MNLDYHKVLVPNETPYESFQEHIHRYAFASRFAKDRTVLDIACGTGYGASYLSSYAALTVGADIAESHLEYARKHYDHKGLLFLQTEAAQLPFGDQSFDVIVSFETIEHVENYRSFLSECKRALKKDGIFLCSTPNKQIFSLCNRIIAPNHVKEFYIAEFHHLLGEYFTDVTLYAQRYMSFSARLMNLLFKLISLCATAVTIKERIKKLLGCKEPLIARLGTEINDEIMDGRYKLLPYSRNFFSTPACITAVAKKGTSG